MNADVLIPTSTGHLEVFAQSQSVLAFTPKLEQRSSNTDAAPLSASTFTPPTPIRAPAEILTAIEDTALRYATHGGIRASELSSLDWLALFRANIEIESGYNPAAVSHVGAIGLGQLMPETAKDLGVDPHSVDENLDGSARYLLTQLERFGTAELALAAYNAGPEAVEKHGGIPPYPETESHVRKVMAVWARLNS